MHVDPIVRHLDRLIVAAPLFIACATYFPVENASQAIAGIDCSGEQKKSFDYKADRKHEAVYAKVQNTGTCPMKAAVKRGGDVEGDPVDVAPGTTALVRNAPRDFALEVWCTPSAVPNPSCQGTLTFVPEVKGKPPQGLAVTPALTILDGKRPQPPTKCGEVTDLGQTFVNRGPGATKLSIEVNNQGNCNTCRVLINGQPAVSDANGGKAASDLIDMPAGNAARFSLDCVGPENNNCVGTIKISTR